MSDAATQIAAREFDTDFFRLPAAIQQRIQHKIDAMGFRLSTSSHYRMTGFDKFRLRIGDYRVIYRFDLAKGEIYLLALGHRSEVYRGK